MLQPMSKTKVFNHLMVDIETMGTSSDAIILSIAAVPFDLATGEFKTFFWKNISLESNEVANRSIDASTLRFWFNQSKKAQIGLFDGEPLCKVLRDFQNFIKNNTLETYMQTGNNLQIWSNGISFDICILKHAFNQIGGGELCHYSLERDVRTLVSLNPSIKDNTRFEGTKHNPLHDCLHQIKYCSETFKSLAVQYSVTKV